MLVNRHVLLTCLVYNETNQFMWFGFVALTEELLFRRQIKEVEIDQGGSTRETLVVGNGGMIRQIRHAQLRHLYIQRNILMTK